jgi:hypothetical protein
MVRLVSVREVQEAAQSAGYLIPESDFSEDSGSGDEVMKVRCAIDCLLRHRTSLEKIESMTPQKALDWCDSLPADTLTDVLAWDDVFEPDFTEDDEFTDIALKTYCAMDCELQCGICWEDIRNMTFKQILEHYDVFLQEDVF